MRRLAAFAFAALLPVSAHALEVGEAEYVYSSDLLADGFTPFAVSSVGQAIYGLRNDTTLYLCFIADTGDAQAMRQATLLAELRGEDPDRTVPNIPVVCILTQ